MWYPKIVQRGPPSTDHYDSWKTNRNISESGSGRDIVFHSIFGIPSLEVEKTGKRFNLPKEISMINNRFDIFIEGTVSVLMYVQDLNRDATRTARDMTRDIREV